MKSILILFTLSPLSAFAAPFCVGNFAGSTLTWELKIPNSHMAEFESLPQDPAQEWQCVDLDEHENYTAEVYISGFKYDSNACVTSVHGGQWLKVKEAAGKLRCDHLTDDGQVDNVKLENLGQQTNYVLNGSVTILKPIEGATIRILNPAGRAIFSQPHATSRNGVFSIHVPTPKLEGYVVEADGGEVNGHEFKGHLSARIGDEFDVETGLLHLNIPTTLVRDYEKAKKPNVGDGEAVARVKSFLNIPEVGNFASDVENPYLKSFSAAVFEHEAFQIGWDRYIDELTKEMLQSPDTVHSFSAPTMLGDWKDDLAMDAIKFIGGQAGSAIFSEFRKGIGFPDQGTQIMDKLNQILGRLDDIERELKAIQAKLDKFHYEDRVIRLNEMMSQYRTLLGKIHDLNKMAYENTDPVTKEAKDQAKAAAYKKIGEGYEKQIIDLGDSFVTTVHAQLVPISVGLEPLQLLWSRYIWDGNNVIKKDYFQILQEEVDQYRVFQAMVGVLLADAKRASLKPGESDADVQLTIQSIARLIGEEKVIYPPEKIAPFLFKKAEVESIITGRAIYDKIQNRVWELSYKHFSDVHAFENWAGNEKFYKTPWDEGPIIDLLNDAKLPDSNFAGWMKMLGFAPAEVDNTRMIFLSVKWCSPSTEASCSDHFRWFGWDRKGPWDRYIDDNFYFERAQDKLNYHKISVMLYHTP